MEMKGKERKGKGMRGEIRNEVMRGRKREGEYGRGCGRGRGKRMGIRKGE